MRLYASYYVSFREERRHFSVFERVWTPFFTIILIIRWFNCFINSRLRGCEAFVCRAGYCDGSERKVTQTNLSEKGPWCAGNVVLVGENFLIRLSPVIPRTRLADRHSFF